MKYPFFLFCFFFSSLSAQEPLSKTPLEQMIEPRLTLESAFVSEANIAGYDGGVAVSKNKISLNNKIVGLSYTNWAFKWNNIEALPFGDTLHTPIEQMHSFKLNTNIPYKIDEKWFWLSSLSVSSTFENQVQNSFGGGFFSFLSYKLSDNHTFEMGAFANYHPITTLALPVMSYSYRARQNDGMKIILGFPRSYVGYHLHERVLLRLGMIFSQSLIRLSDTSTIEHAGYIESKDYMSNIGVSYNMSEDLKFESDLLYSIKRDFTLYDSGAHELQSHSIEPSFGFNIKLRYLF